MPGEIRARTLSPLVWSYAGLILFSIVGHFISARWHLDPGPIAPIASAATLLCGCTALFLPHAAGRWGITGGLLLSGALVELVGLSTGFPFGAYAYTDKWTPVVHLWAGWFPLLVPFAWLLVAGCSYYSVSSLVPGWRAVLLGGGIGAALDAVMEPVMTRRLHYWEWKGGTPPWPNYVAWFAMVSLAGWVLSRSKYEADPCPARIVLAGQVVLMLAFGAS